MRIALDAMGGDHAPGEVVRGAVEAVALLGSGDEIVLVGRRDSIEAHLPGGTGVPGGLAIHHAEDVITMDDSPVEALRQKKDSSIGVMAKLASEGRVDAVISAGNTGACAAAFQLRMRTLGSVQRPGIAVVVPSFSGPMVLCDVGANVSPKPFHLLQYAQMASVYAETILGISSPRVALLSIGSEDVKGSPLVKQTRDLIRQDAGLNFVGNVEGRELFSGACDVAICDGFVGNVVLKLSEGLSENIFRSVAREIGREDAKLAGQFEPVVKRIWARHDYSEYGGAPLLGVNGTCIICHGSSSARAIRNAIRVAMQYVRSGLNELMAGRLAEEPAHA